MMHESTSYSLTCDGEIRGKRKISPSQEQGSKRCPHATFHGNECTNSNASGQPGSRYP